ncbi:MULTISPECIES: Uma2 family endonuclease [Nostoc]|uniref:Uma2 family endonuclease n=1 Tax=Nostoc paludosum FACHB-159 TaxID=2692908 RepID=A0ABR8K544_9NOSO|nr:MULTISPECIES: Uma2 family endonuclease [Nostoc]MBD2677098.1 Uma2 family endonuclease [Nostoc sp. FACHB-857]MBD2733297.1 Uma2 family endonuclease [Nostoc paludosum FACHB-159]
MISTDTTAQLLMIPPLENGDKLTRAEFERRYHAMPNLKKAELIEGVVYVASPLRIKSHGEPHAYMIAWLGVYKAATPGVGFADNTTLLLDADNEPQPDALLRIEQGGQTRITQDDYLEGAPELIVEIAASSASYDLHEKLKVYRRNKVQEYLVWRVYDQQFDWFKLNEGEYIKLETNSNSIVCSQVFSGLWLDKAALLSGNLAKVLAVLQQGLSTPEHQNFVEKLSI